MFHHVVQPEEVDQFESHNLRGGVLELQIRVTKIIVNEARPKYKHYSAGA